MNMNEIDKEKRPFFHQDNSLFVRSGLRVHNRTARVFPWITACIEILFCDRLRVSDCKRKGIVLVQGISIGILGGF